MSNQSNTRWIWPGIFILALAMGLLAGCGSSGEATHEATESLSLPVVEPMVSSGERLEVLATTSIIGDVVRQVGGEAIDLTVLMQPGQDPHSYQPGAADLTAAADANIIFVNGWNLEEGLVDDLVAIGGDAVMVPVSAGIAPLGLGDTEEEHAAEEQSAEARDHGPADPHTWQDVANVITWVENIRQVLGAADPANATIYDANAAAYRRTLEELDAEIRETLTAIPPAQRILVTNHESMGYFAAAYDFEVVGAIIPAVSTLAEPSAGALANLAQMMRERGVCTLVLETTTSDQLARTLETELADCDGIRLVTLYTGALGPAGSGADSYAGMMLSNAQALAEVLEQ